MSRTEAEEPEGELPDKVTMQSWSCRAYQECRGLLGCRVFQAYLHDKQQTQEEARTPWGVRTSMQLRAGGVTCFVRHLHLQNAARHQHGIEGAQPMHGAGLAQGDSATWSEETALLSVLTSALSAGTKTDTRSWAFWRRSLA